MSQGTTKGIPIDTDATLAANSDQLVASQKATKTYADTKLSASGGTLTNDLTVTGVTISDTDGTGTITMASQSSTPSSPTDTKAKIWMRNAGGREQPMLLSSQGTSRVLDGVPSENSFVLITPQSSTSVRTQGMGAAATTAGTISHPAITARGYFAQSSQSNAGFSASFYSDNLFYRGASSDIYAGFYVHARFYLPDASYDNTGASTGTRINAGIFAGSMAATDRHTAAHAITFNRCHVNGGATDTDWQFVTSDGSNANTVPSGLTFTTQHVYDVRIWCPAGATTVYGQIDDLTAGTTSGEVSSSSNLPGATTAMAPVLDIRTINATARLLQMSRLYGVADKG
jgi:hypothetical protein